jgi:hypothetical protein
VREIEQGVPEHNPCTVMCIRGNLEAAGQDPSTATVVIIATHHTPHTTRLQRITMDWIRVPTISPFHSFSTLYTKDSAEGEGEGEEL